MHKPGPGERFLHQKDPTLQTSQPVEHEQKRIHRQGQETSQKSANKITTWLQLLERTHMGHADEPRVLERIKESYHRQYVTLTLDDIPQSYWNNKAKIMIAQGYGGDMTHSGIHKEEYTDEQGNTHTNYIFPEGMQAQELAVVLSNQKRSLDKWIDYLTSDDAMYPMWAKYWVFTSVVKMGKFEKVEETVDGVTKQRGRFQRRTKDTTASFPLLNPRALARTIGVMTARLEEKQKAKKDRVPIPNESERLDDAAFRQLLATEDFRQLYAQFLVEIPVYSTEGLQEIQGEWRKYEQGTNPDQLVRSLDGYPLEWCTADPDTAKAQLKAGDFYVYYSLDEDGNAVVPRLAIRMNGTREIAEDPRGIAPDQNLDPYIAPVLEEKLEEFGDVGEVYKQKASDMKRLTDIWERNNADEELTKEDLRFLYQIDAKIQGFGYADDPRIEQILNGRNTKQDLVLVTGLQEHEISVTQEEALSGDIKWHFGDLDLRRLTSAEGLTLPNSVGGNLYLERLTSAEGLTLPNSVGGDLALESLTSAEGLTLPNSVGGYLDLSSLTSAEGLTLPDSVGGNLTLESLTSAEGLTLPNSVGGHLDLSSLTSAEGLTLPNSVGGYLDLSSLTSAEGLTLPNSIGGDLYLERLTSAEGLTLPNSVGRHLYLGRLTSAEGLTLPDSVGGYLTLESLTSAEGLTLPNSVGGNLDLSSLTSAEGITWPRSVNGSIFAPKLGLAERAKLPIHISSILRIPE